MAPKTKETCIHKLGVTFGNVSIGDGTARLGIELDRAQIGIEEAERLFCGRRLTGSVVVLAGDESPDQAHLFDDGRPSLSTTFDAKRFSVGPKDVTTGLTFALAEINVETLSHFAKRKGQVRIETVATLETADDAEAEAEAEAGDDASDRLFAHDLSHLGLPDKLARKLRDLGHESVGDIHRAMSRNGGAWARSLTKDDRSLVADALIEFWQRHPDLRPAA